MKQHLDPKPLRVFIESDKGEKEVDFKTVDPAEFFKNDLVRYRFTGAIPHGADFSIVNFIGCELFDITANDLDFSECDFKDTLIKGARFINCTFDGGTFATTFLSETEFRRCTFDNHAAYSCDFRQVRFVNCDLTNLLIKSSRFSQCLFQNCITSNKICEMSTLFDVTFENTQIQLETITNNFGLTSTDLENSPVRSGRARETHQPLNLDDLKSHLGSPNVPTLERLALEYFLEPNLLNGSPVLDEALNIARWTKIYRNPGSFVELLDKFAEFLIHLHDNNKLTYHPILLLHQVTSTLTESIPQEKEFFRVATALGGIHLILSRIVEDFLHALDLTSQNMAGTVVFLAEGPTDPDYFRRELAPWIGDDVRISRLERNSPLFIEFTAANVLALLSLLGAFIATRTKLEIKRLRTTKQPEETEGIDNQLKIGKRRDKRAQKKLPGKAEQSLQRVSEEAALSLFSVKSNSVTKPNPSYELRVRALMPGSLLLDLKLNFSTTFARRLRTILLTLLGDPPRKLS